MKAREFWALVFLVAAMTAMVAVVGNRMRRWGPHSASLDLSTEVTAPQYGLNKPMPDVTLTDLGGVRHSVKASRGKVVVLLVQGNHCPCSEAYVDRMNAIQRDYAPLGVEVLAFNPNVNETPEQTKRYVAEHHVEYPVAYDAKGVAADLLGAACMTETWVVDREGYLRYHGRIDNNIYHPEQAKQRDLRNALDDVLKGCPVRVPETRAYACTINRGEGGT